MWVWIQQQITSRLCFYIVILIYWRRETVVKLFTLLEKKIVWLYTELIDIIDEKKKLMTIYKIIYNMWL